MQVADREPIAPAAKLILVIDDEPAISWLLGSTFRGRGHDVETASNGRDGLAHARRRPPDVVVLDVVMPGMDGFRVLEELRSAPLTATVPVLVMSAAFDPSFGPRARQHGVSFIEKPFDWANVVRAVEELLLGSGAFILPACYNPRRS
jgi:CheY-like chemotaxis protein